MPDWNIPQMIVPAINLNQWEFQDPKMEVLYHIRHYKAIFSGDIPPT